jgi:hypothetical protein
LTTSLLFRGAGAPRTKPANGWKPPAPPPVSTAASISNSLSSSFLLVMRWGGEVCLFARACAPQMRSLLSFERNEQCERRQAILCMQCWPCPADTLSLNSEKTGCDSDKSGYNRLCTRHSLTWAVVLSIGLADGGMMQRGLTCCWKSCSS